MLNIPLFIRFLLLCPHNLSFTWLVFCRFFSKKGSVPKVKYVRIKVISDPYVFRVRTESTNLSLYVKIQTKQKLVFWYFLPSYSCDNSADNYMLKVNNKNTGTRCEICSLRDS